MGKKLLIQAVYEHPLVRHLADCVPQFLRGRPGLFARGLPSYIPSRTFAIALIDVLRGTRGAADAIGAGSLLAGAQSSIEKVADPELRRVLTLLIGDAEQMAQTVTERSRLVSERLEGWFNDRMARAEGRYKRRAQAWSLGLALGVTVLFNADTLYLTQRLWNDGALREAVVAMAQAERAPDAGEGDVLGQLLGQVRELESSVLPLGCYWEEGAGLPCARRATSAAGSECWEPSIWSRVLLVVGLAGDGDLGQPGRDVLVRCAEPGAALAGDGRQGVGGDGARRALWRRWRREAAGSAVVGGGGARQVELGAAAAGGGGDGVAGDGGRAVRERVGAHG